MAETTKTLNTRIAQLSFNAADWNESVILLKGEIGFETDTRKMKVGDGTTAWGVLDYVNPDYILPVADTNKLGGVMEGGDVIIDASGIMTIADATSAAHGLMTSADFTKLAGISDGANKVEASATNGHIKIDGSDTTVYAHPTYTSATSDLYKVAVDGTGHVSSTTKVVKSDIDSLVGLTTSAANGLMTSADFTKLGGIASGAQVNVLEGVQFKGSGESSFADLTIDANKKVQIDLSLYALKADVSSVFKFKGTVATVNELPTSGNTVGDVWFVTAEDSEYVYVDATGTGTWEELGPAIDLSEYVTTDTKVNGQALSGDITLDGSDIALTGYTKASAAAAVAASDTVNQAVGKLEYKIDVLNGNDSTTGSVANSIKTAIEGLDVTAVSGDYITAVGEVDGKVTVTASSKGTVASGSTGLVDGDAVYNALAAQDITISSGTAGSFTYTKGNGSAVTVTTGADANVIESVKVNGSALTASSKAVDILITEGTANGSIKVNGSDVSVHGLGSAAFTSSSIYLASNATVNGNAFASNAVVIDGADIKLDGYSIASTAAAIVASDTVNQALGKLEYKVDHATTGTVTSVGLSMPSIFGVNGSPVTSSGTFTVSLNNQTANKVFAGPSSGSAAAPAFRELAEADIPALSISKITNLQTSLDGKADKVSGAKTGNFAGLDANGNLTDSGSKAADFATAAQGANADTAIQSVTGDTYVSATTINHAVTLATSNKVVTTDDYIIIQCSLPTA